MSNPATASIPFRHLRVLAASLALALAGCATPVLKPSLDVPDRFAAATASADEPEVAWWEGFKDPVLSDLIRRAAQQNRDVKIAAERLRAARAGETISRSWLFPSVSVGGAAFDHKTNYDSVLKNFVPEAANTRAAQVGVGVTWEVDLFGRLRAGAAAAAADTLAVENGARGVRLLVLSDVATNYFTLVGALRQLETVRAISAAQDETLRLVTARQRAGLATPFDVERAQTEASRARAAIPPLETLAAVSRHRIAVLIGDQAFKQRASRRRPSKPPFRRRVRVNRPSCCSAGRTCSLRARSSTPPTRAGNRRWRNGSRGSFSAPCSVARASISMAWPLARRASPTSRRCWRCRSSTPDARRRSTTSPRADNAKPSCATRTRSRAHWKTSRTRSSRSPMKGNARRRCNSAAASADAALGRAQSLYDRGQIDLLPLLDAQRVRLAVRVGANDANTQLLLDSVQLYKALGGGWQAFEPVADPAASANPNSPTS